jgi:hypothetical protein
MSLVNWSGRVPICREYLRRLACTIGRSTSRASAGETFYVAIVDSGLVESVQGGFGFVVEDFGLGVLFAEAVDDGGGGFGHEGFVA